MVDSFEYEHRYYYLFACSIKNGAGNGPDSAEIRVMTSRPTPSFEPPPYENVAHSSPPLLHLALMKNKTTWFRLLLSVCNPEVKWRHKGIERTLDYSLKNHALELRNRWREAKITWQESRAAKQAFEVLLDNRSIEAKRQAANQMTSRDRLGSWAAAIGLITSGIDAIIAPLTAGIPVITLGYSIFQAIVAWRREIKSAREENLVTNKAQVMFDATEIFGASIIWELHDQRKLSDVTLQEDATLHASQPMGNLLANGDASAPEILGPEGETMPDQEHDFTEILYDQAMRTRRWRYSNKPKRDKMTAVGAIIGGLLDVQMRRLLDDFSGSSNQTDALFGSFQRVERKLAGVKTSPNNDDHRSPAAAPDRVAPATSRETPRSNSSKSSGFAPSAVIPAVWGVSSSSDDEIQSQTTTIISTQNALDETNIDDTLVHCHNFCEFCLQKLSP